MDPQRGQGIKRLPWRPWSLWSWPPTGRQLLWTAGIVAALVFALVFVVIVFYSYRLGWKWSGLPKKTLWDWLSLLIVPIVLALGGYLFTRSETRATQAAADRRAQDEALQAYLDGMAQMLTEKERPLRRARPGDSLSSVARARTLTVLSRLDGDRKARVLQFLYEAGLITKGHPVLALAGADLRKAELFGADLSGVKLFGADLSGADLNGASLYRADLRKADLSGAYLGGAALSEARLNGAYLRRTTLDRADLRKADLSDADLGNADLSGADLSEAQGWTEEQLSRAASLEDATMPDVQILKGHDTPYRPTFEEWLKDRARRGEDVENE